MSRRTATALLLIAAACMMVISCTGKGRSDDQNFYFTTLKTDGEARVSFDIDMSDSTCVYGISLVSRFRKDANLHFFCIPCICLKRAASWKKPAFRSGLCPHGKKT